MRAMASRVRPASHAGSWYSDDKGFLGSEVGDLMERARGKVEGMVSTRAVISPHAGLSYSGRTAAHGFAALEQSIKAQNARRVFILGPSHHMYLEEIRPTSFTSYATPFGNIDVDTETVKDIFQRGKQNGLAVKYLPEDADEEEHSIELQMPFLGKLLAGSGAKIVPIVVGHIGAQKEEAYGKLLAPYFDDPQTLFVISSDFCHWGPRFRYQYHWEKEKYPEVADSIIAMDHEAMRLIEAQDHTGLTKYFATTGNTICGRSPIGVLLGALTGSSGRHQIKFVHYSQSNRCKGPRDNSVSYASAVITRSS